MCQWGIKATQVKLSEPRKSGRTHVPVDPCIAPLVQAMNDNGMKTKASCCGHGKRPGSIIYESPQGEDMEILVMTFEEARKLDKNWPPIS